MSAGTWQQQLTATEGGKRSACERSGAHEKCGEQTNELGSEERGKGRGAGKKAKKKARGEVRKPSRERLPS